MDYNFTIDELRSNPEIYWIDSRIESGDVNLLILNELAEHFENYYGDCLIRNFKLFPGSILKRLIKNNRLDEVNFLPSIFEQKELRALSQALDLPEKKVKLKLSGFKTDIFTLGGQIARMLAQGGPYTKMNEKQAWKLGMRLTEEAFGNRFTDVLFYTITLPNAKWFDGIAWDYCFLLVDKQKMEITFIAITGSD